MRGTAADLARHLASHAEAVCRHYLSNGRRHGRYWLVGDVDNSKGRSLYVRLHQSANGRGAAGRWSDAATGEHGDLLDLIARNKRLTRLRDVLDEARDFFRLPRPEPTETQPPAPTGSPEAARRLYASGRSILGTPAETYLRKRGITASLLYAPLRYHPRCFYRDEHGPDTAYPALLAAVTGADGTITGLQRTWLTRAGDKAAVESPRRAMGNLLGNGVRFGPVHDVLGLGEGIETMLSLQTVLPTLPIVAALSASHLAAFDLPTTLRRLYIARDNDAAGCWAAKQLTTRAAELGIDALTLVPTLGDFNDDLRALAAHELAAALRVQLAAEDAERFLPPRERRAG